MPTEFSHRAREILAHVDKHSHLFYGPVVPLYRDNEREIPDPIGSALLINVRDQLFLVSAAHVLDHLAAGENMWFPASQNRRRHLGGTLHYKLMSREDRKQDKTDVAVLKLEGEGATLHERCVPITLASLLPNSERRANEWCVVVGFPASKTKCNTHTKSATTQPYAAFSPSLDPVLYAKYGLQPDRHVAISFRSKDMLGDNDSRQTFPSTEGMSGSPVWMLAHQTAEASYFLIVGILIAHRRKDALLIATDISVAIDRIAILLGAGVGDA